nr:Coiled-coil domain-containing protein 81 [Polyrhizophydium stewartii]
MDQLDLEDVIKVVCETISKSKRFSELSHLELCDLWKGMACYLMDQLIMKRSTNISGIGGFHIKKMKKGVSDEKTIYSAHFSPSKTWDKLPGFQIDRCDAVGIGPAEVMNLASVAQITGFPRDLVEAGLKDIVHALFKILKRGSIVNLAFGTLGKLVFQSQNVKFRFSQAFLKALNEEKTPSVQIHRCGSTPGAGSTHILQAALI